MNDQRHALEELESLTSLGPRFHGTPGVEAAAEALSKRLSSFGLHVARHPVQTPGWRPGTAAQLVVTRPLSREIPCYPTLWSGSSGGEVEAAVVPCGPQGLWADAMTWRRFAAVADGHVVGYIHGRDRGPAAPQPLPIGSDVSLPHLAIGHLDGLQLQEWVSDGHEVRVRLSADASQKGRAVSDTLTVTLDGRASGSSTNCVSEPYVVVGAHYDTFFNTPGAYDNGSGTIALLLLAERWATEPPRVPVTLAFFTAEEWHLAGSRSYVAGLSAPERDRVQYMINLDGIGRGDHLEIFAAPESFERDITGAIQAYGLTTRDRLEITSRFPPTFGTDHGSFWGAGVPAAHLTFNDLSRLHQPDDLPNDEIAANVAWVVGLVSDLVDHLPPPIHSPQEGINLPL